MALNAHPQLPRAAICALALNLDAWIDSPEEAETAQSQPQQLTDAALAQQLGVSQLHLERARLWLTVASKVAYRERKLADQASVRILTLLDSDYPSSLRDLSLPPPVLYVDGQIPNQPAVAIVGSRRADTYGLEVAHRFARHLATTHLTIVSGYARGIDGAAHRGALETPAGRTVAILGCGIDVEYPRTHRSLGRSIRDQGALVSEFPMGTEPRAHHFPIRNRLIAALSLGTLVVRAAVRSGSLITARLALDLGRDVYAVPGAIFDPGSLGPNTLIRDGALIAQHPRDILEALSLYTDPARAQAEPLATSLPTPKSGKDGRILEALQDGGRQTPDALSQQLSMPIDDLLTRLLELELGGYVERLPGPLFVRAG